ncbi:DUF5723 family protein [Flavivirga eckloniae]|uniref:DUF5723 domain-containing protein n=1 Tax=Flavivirga eckloniae TaxID=1803846 RepID=A0A2K9PTD7_9FLAO|nr:DUF5723 family protein [Flavivirga eckloniae]AUP80331.1 hypothetical protein C1H87_17095 [Flavivirga eckloniae]
MRSLSLFFIITSCCFSFSQNKQLLFGFSDIPQSLMVNPGGEVKNDWYFGIPLLSHIHTNVGISGSTVYDIFADDGVDFNTKLRNAIRGMSHRDFFSANQQLEIFSGGFAFGDRFQKNEYVSFGLYQELDFIAYFPKDFAMLALNGNGIGVPFRANQLSVRAEAISVLHLGYNKKVNDKFSFGVRGKIYSSIANIDFTNNKGSFVTVRGQNNFYDHIFNLDLEGRTSGLASLGDDDSEGSNSVVKDLRKRVLLGGNLGLGFDIGVSHQLNEQLHVEASLLDVGFISHKKDVENYKIEGDYVFEGVNPLFPETDIGQTAEQYWDEIEQDLEDLFTVDTTTSKYTTWRPVKFNASLNYSFGQKEYESCNCSKEDNAYLNKAGLQLYAISRPKQPQMALTAYYYRRLFEGLQVKTTYTIDSYSAYNIGLGMYTNLGGLNFYVMADNFLQLQNIYDAQSVSLQIGFNYIFNKKDED